MRLKFLAVIGAMFLLAACGTSSEEGGTTTGSGSAGGGGGSATTTSLAGPTSGSQEDLVVNVGDRVFFGFDRFDLTAEARATLDRVAAWLDTNPSVTLTIEGHADERGTREYNLALGERRATAARNYLVSLGIASGRLSTVSFGEERPAVLGSNEEAWAQNRRAVFVVN